MAVEYLAERLNTTVRRIRFKGLTGSAHIKGQSVVLLMPQTYMNLSGESVGEAARFYGIPTENIIVLYDDKEIPLGRLRVRSKGSSGGHNGMKSIIEHLGSDSFPRIRIGIGGEAVSRDALCSFVLGAYTKEEQQVVFSVLGLVAQGVELIIGGDVQEAQSRLNGMNA